MCHERSVAIEDNFTNTQMPTKSAIVLMQPTISGLVGGATRPSTFRGLGVFASALVSSSPTAPSELTSLLILV